MQMWLRNKKYLVEDQ